MDTNWPEIDKDLETQDPHIKEDAPRQWEVWYAGDRDQSYFDAAELHDVVIELTDLTDGCPDELDGWQVKNTATGEVLTGRQVMEQHSNLGAI